MSTRVLRAYVDESLSDHQRDPGTYILAAGIADPEDHDQIRGQLRQLRLRGQHKLHWRDESSKRQQLIITTIEQLPLTHLIVVRDEDTSRPERRRRLCMERLLFELDQLQIATATFESRGPADDKRDRDMVGQLRARKTITSALRIEHEKGALEPMLWIPDAVCGATTSHRTSNTDYLGQLTTAVQMINI